MRSKPIFTPSDLRRYQTLGRGTGVYESFIGWHRVTRSDPSSKGRSHLQTWKDRQHDLLSDLELVAFFFATMHPEVIDIREQFPLNLVPVVHEINVYREVKIAGLYPGTIALADKLEMEHPIVGEDGSTAPWVMTTDLLLTLKNTAGKMSLLAVSVKPKKPKLSRRQRALLTLEREYWLVRNVPWLLITNDLYDDLAADLLKGQSSWALAPEYNQSVLDWLGEHKLDFNQCNLTQILQVISAQCANKNIAQNTFWRAVWTGVLPFDLRRTWRPSAPFVLLTPTEFWEINPIVSRRSAWPA